MKKLVLSFAITAALGLSGCDSETLKDVQEDAIDNGTVVQPAARVVFDPTNGLVSVPNDLLFLGTTDGTLELPVEDPTNFGDPYVALSALDGWSTTSPFNIAVEFPAGNALDASSVNSGSVRVFETIFGGPTAPGECANVPQGAACTVVGELVFGQDFVAQAGSTGINIVPIVPLKAKTSYLVVLTNDIMDDTGGTLAPSVTYELVQQDINTHPLGSESQLQLQGAVNSFEAAVSAAGVDKETIVYSMAMTTQSTVDSLGAVKSIYAAGLQQNIVPSISMVDIGVSVADIFALQGIQLPPEQAALYSAANYLKGAVTLPYYSGVPTAENPLAPVNANWNALCDSGAMLAGLAAQNPGAIPPPTEPLSASDAQCIAISQASGLPAPGLRDLSSLFPLDVERNITKFNPVPAPKANPTLEVQMTTPDLPVVNYVRSQMGMEPIAEPEAGWPVVIMQHGITSRKEDMLAATGMLAVNGFATIAIDHPLHGTRGFDLDGDGIDELNASTVSAAHYLNVGSLLSSRDNMRQSTSDMLGLRLGVNFISGSHVESHPVKVDTTNVHFLGHSLGAITGINFMALTNAPLNPAIDPLFNVKTNSLGMPGVMVANFLLESASFSLPIKSGLAYQAIPEFKAFVDNTYGENPSDEQIAEGFVIFYDNLPPESQAEVDATFLAFTFAAQTAIDSGDPVNYAQMMAATQTPTHLIEVIGNGGDNLSDRVIPNAVSTTPLSGTEAAIRLLGLESVSTTTQTSMGAVRFINGHHSSLLDPSPNSASPDPALSGLATLEMQTQFTTFFATMGQLVAIGAENIVQ